ncbi:hypothetical protein E2C01_036056 [Portunus trituberculatus]|uniref:Secreted protein n=1 Tax=Portunus trituberculatus TaxID=210409 RepID=A0A5B7FBE4_PORTR|nr:hypothetical protein [Portunus trituberculatus]
MLLFYYLFFRQLLVYLHLRLALESVTIGTQALRPTGYSVAASSEAPAVEADGGRVLLHAGAATGCYLGSRRVAAPESGVAACVGRVEAHVEAAGRARGGTWRISHGWSLAREKVVIETRLVRLG